MYFCLLVAAVAASVLNVNAHVDCTMPNQYSMKYAIKHGEIGHSLDKLATLSYDYVSYNGDVNKVIWSRREDYIDRTIVDIEKRHAYVMTDADNVCTVSIDEAYPLMDWFQQHSVVESYFEQDTETAEPTRLIGGENVRVERYAKIITVPNEELFYYDDVITYVKEITVDDCLLVYYSKEKKIIDWWGDLVKGPTPVYEMWAQEYSTVAQDAGLFEPQVICPPVPAPTTGGSEGGTAGGS